MFIMLIKGFMTLVLLKYKPPMAIKLKRIL